MTRSAHPAATATGAHTLCRENHLQHFVRVFKEVSEFVTRRAEYFLRKLRRHLDPCHRRIFRNIANFVYLDAGLPRQRGFQLLGKGRRLGVSTWEGAHKSRELRLCEIRRKMNAGNSRGDQHLRETSFARRRSQRHSIQQDLVS
jgi:hypothetical protein